MTALLIFLGWLLGSVVLWYWITRPAKPRRDQW